jgi:hypothetical protein
MSDEPRTKKASYLATGTLQNAPCEPCGKDTTHKNGVCLTCGAGPKPRRGRISKRPTVKA